MGPLILLYSWVRVRGQPETSDNGFDVHQFTTNGGVLHELDFRIELFPMLLARHNGWDTRRRTKPYKPWSCRPNVLVGAPP